MYLNISLGKSAVISLLEPTVFLATGAMAMYQEVEDGGQTEWQTHIKLSDATLPSCFIYIKDAHLYIRNPRYTFITESSQRKEKEEGYQIMLSVSFYIWTH